MIKYELSKKLKEAGFPQGGNGGWQLQDTDNERFYSPTLSELIEACGDKFWRLQQLTKMGDCQHWMAEGAGIIEEHGHTPEEAVVNLWLKLNKR